MLELSNIANFIEWFIFTRPHLFIYMISPIMVFFFKTIFKSFLAENIKKYTNMRGYVFMYFYFDYVDFLKD